eukprot:CAMPEP_0182502622 /NCGR_PEP_ID=MMETSP1321-20130603/13813_1 /TAXON_ID=91990 /ORGANISM="Bolidomonas sp., Strain RCC1657" /LENGTH=181 /DNA_ID=CAMNT_0024707601 /DNA_START=245 /DNA_END=790 /DNA_ORIENTATION=-
MAEKALLQPIPLPGHTPRISSVLHPVRTYGGVLRAEVHGVPSDAQRRRDGLNEVEAEHVAPHHGAVLDLARPRLPRQVEVGDHLVLLIELGGGDADELSVRLEVLCHDQAPVDAGFYHAVAIGTADHGRGLGGHYLGREGVVVLLAVGELGCAKPPVVVYDKEGRELLGEVHSSAVESIDK